MEHAQSHVQFTVSLHTILCCSGCQRGEEAEEEEEDGRRPLGELRGGQPRTHGASHASPSTGQLVQVLSNTLEWRNESHANMRWEDETAQTCSREPVLLSVQRDSSSIYLTNWTSCPPRAGVYRPRCNLHWVSY